MSQSDSIATTISMDSEDELACRSDIMPDVTSDEEKSDEESDVTSDDEVYEAEDDADDRNRRSSTYRRTGSY